MTKLITAYTTDDALSALAEEVGTHEREGARTIIFCEDRLTLLAERAVLKACGGTFLAEVTTFRRFLNLHAGGRTLSKQGSVLEIAALMGKYEDKLTCFRRRAAQAVYETIAQLSASRVTEEDLLACAEETEGLLKRKISDLAFLLGKYHEFLRERALVDENGYLALLPALIAEKAADAHVIFFAFPSFTRQGQACIRAAAGAARSTTGIFTGGDREYHTNEAAAVFRRACEGEVAETRAPTLLAGDALLVSRALFSTERAPRDLPRAYHVRTFVARDENEEMEKIAAYIRKEAAEGRRYSDIAVLVGSEDYLLAVQKAFRAYRIPYFADVKKKFSEHPFCVFLLNVLDAAADGALPDEADAVASSVYFGRSEGYRNYLLRYGAYRGGVRREIKGLAVRGKGYGSDEELTACRKKMLAILDLFRLGKKATGRDYTAAVRALRTLVEEEKVTEALARSLPPEERALTDLTPLEGILRETEDVAGEEVFTPREFSRLIASGLEAYSVSVLPRRSDAVFVGDATESRMCRAEVLFCAGLTEALPRVSQDTAVITDSEIERLGKLRVEIDPAMRVVNARARESLALNLCAFSEELILSCPISVKGEETSPSEVFYYLEKSMKTAPMPELYPYDRSEREPAMHAFFRDLDLYFAEKSKVRAEELIGRISALRTVLMDAGEEEKCLPADPEELRGKNEKTAKGAGELWLSRDASPTRLEQYFSCPYKGFALGALRLSEREERSLLGSDTGNFIHAVLKETADRFGEFSTEEECRAAAASSAKALLAGPVFGALADTAAGRYAAERLVWEAENVAALAYRQLLNSAYRVLKTEGEVAIPALHIRGKADRVDVSGGFVRVIDYKTGDFDVSAEAYYTGRSLQLELYLRAVSEGGMSAGSFYFPAKTAFTDDGERRDPYPHRMEGIYCSDPEVVAGFDTVRGGKASEIFESGTKTCAFPRQDFETLLDYGELAAKQAESEMGSGNIAPSPYSGACTYCKLKGMCGFSGEPREKEKITFAEIIGIAAACGGEDHE